MSNQIVRVFLEIDMRNQHEGLLKTAKKENVNLKTLEPGEHVVFLNRALNRLKLYSSHGVLTYVRAESGRINLNMIKQIPYCFHAKTGMDWSKAARLALEEQFKNQKMRKAPKPEFSHEKNAQL